MLVRIFFAALLFAAGLVTNDIVSAQGQVQSKPEAAIDAPEPIMDQRALDALKVMSDTLSQAKTIRFQARSIVPVKGPGDIWISLYGTSRVVKEGTDKLFAETRGDFFPYDFYFDGKKIMAYSPEKNFYAEKDAPGTVDSVIEDAYRKEGKSFPYADILITEPYGLMTKDLEQAVYVGRSTIGEMKTIHLAFINKEVEWQIWIGIEDHLPRLVYATYLDDISEPSYTVEFSDWKLNEPVPAETFTFLNTSNAVKVDFSKSSASGLEQAAEAKQ
jgi:Predicted periplasmic protein